MAGEELMVRNEAELPPRSAARCAGRRPLRGTPSARRSARWRRVAFWSAAAFLALALFSRSALSAQVPPPEWDAWLAAVSARGDASRCLENEVPASLWNAYQMASKTASSRAAELNDAAGPVLMGQFLRGEITPVEYTEEMERRAPEVFNRTLAANEAVLAAQEALKLAAPKRWAALEAAEALLQAASAALGRVLEGPAPDHWWQFPERPDAPCR